jgi:hypothetical protein
MAGSTGHLASTFPPAPSVSSIPSGLRSVGSGAFGNSKRDADRHGVDVAEIARPEMAQGGTRARCQVPADVPMVQGTAGNFETGEPHQNSGTPGTAQHPNTDLVDARCDRPPCQVHRRRQAPRGVRQACTAAGFYHYQS